MYFTGCVCVCVCVLWNTGLSVSCNIKKGSFPYFHSHVWPWGKLSVTWYSGFWGQLFFMILCAHCLLLSLFVLLLSSLHTYDSWTARPFLPSRQQALMIPGNHQWVAGTSSQSSFYDLQKFNHYWLLLLHGLVDIKYNTGDLTEEIKCSLLVSFDHIMVTNMT